MLEEYHIRKNRLEETYENIAKVVKLSSKIKIGKILQYEEGEESSKFFLKQKRLKVSLRDLKQKIEKLVIHMRYSMK